jgi:hypothetical protein
MNKSDSIKEIATALVKFNGEVARIGKDAANPFFKNSYATLDHIIDEVRPILTKYGLSILQIPGGDGENVIMKTLLLHESGEWIESEPLTMKPIKNDPQAVGSCITYARRYSLNSFLSLSTGEDDDGNKASHANESSKQTSAPKQNDAPATTKQTGLIKKLVGDLKSAGSDETAVLDTLRSKVGEFLIPDDMTAQQASQAIKLLNDWKVKKGA